MARKYSHLYELLVEDRADIIGHIAYALYKEDKIESISKYKAEHDGDDPSEESLEKFNEVCVCQGNIDKYKFVASCILQRFLDNSLEESKRDVEDSINRNHIELIKKAIEPIKPKSLWNNYLHGVMQSIIGALIFMLLMCAIVFIVNMSSQKHTFTFTIGGDGNANVRETSIQKNDTTQYLVK